MEDHHQEELHVPNGVRRDEKEDAKMDLSSLGGGERDHGAGQVREEGQGQVQQEGVQGGAQEVGGVDGPGKKPDRKFKQAGRSKKKKLDVPVDQPLIWTFLPVENADAGEEDPPDQMDEFFAGQEFEF